MTGAEADEALALLCAGFNATGVVISQEFSYQGWLRIGGDLRDWPEVYHQVKATDSTIAAIRNAPPGAWFIIERSEDRHRRTPVYEKFIEHRFRDVAIARLPSTQGDFVTMAAYRQTGDPTYDDQEKLYFDLLSPLLARALASRAALVALAQSGSDSSRAAPTSADGFATISYPSGTIRWSSPARALWQKALGPIGDRGWKRIEKALRYAAANPSYSALGAVRATPLIHGISAEFAYLAPRPDESHRLLVLFFERKRPDINVDPEPMCAPEALLSPQQRLVARMTSRGYSLPEIAATLSIKLETARDYLRTAYERLDVDNRADLVRLLS